MRAEPRRLGAALLLTAVAGAPALAADEHIFEPGSKHVCVPAAGGQGWDCRSVEDAPAATAPAPPREPRLRSSSQIPADSTTSAAAAEAAAAAAEPPPPAPASSGGADHAVPAAPVAEPAAAAPAEPAAKPRAAAPAPSAASRNVPHYLLSPEARGAAAAAPTPAASAPAAPPRSTAAAEPVRAAVDREAPAARRDAETARTAAADTAPVPAAPDPPPATPASPASAKASAVPPPTAAPPATNTPAAAAAPETTAVAPTPTPAAAATPPAAAPAPPPSRSETPHPVATPSAAANPAGVPLGAGEFRRLADTRYVVELASGASRSEVESRAAAAAPAQGRVYLLPLRRDGAEWYLAVWGDFDSVDAARTARAQALSDGAAVLGWPRRAGPLKQELGR